MVTGAIDAKGKAALDAIKASFPEILDLTTEGKIATEPMVYLNVQITEFNTNALENLGINWSTSIAGPSVGYSNTFSKTGNDVTLNAFENQTATTSLQQLRRRRVMALMATLVSPPLSPLPSTGSIQW